eukprot:jgi/Ulvmu1/11876/UM081_0034.1
MGQEHAACRVGRKRLNAWRERPLHEAVGVLRVLCHAQLGRPHRTAVLCKNDRNQCGSDVCSARGSSCSTHGNSGCISSCGCHASALLDTVPPFPPDQERALAQHWPGLGWRV